MMRPYLRLVGGATLLNIGKQRDEETPKNNKQSLFVNSHSNKVNLIESNNSN